MEIHREGGGERPPMRAGNAHCEREVEQIKNTIIYLCLTFSQNIPNGISQLFLCNMRYIII